MILKGKNFQAMLTVMTIWYGNVTKVRGGSNTRQTKWPGDGSS